MRSRSTRLVLAAACTALQSSPREARSQYATFSRTTDTITFPTACIGLSASDRISYEALIRVGASGYGGNIYNEIMPFWYDRQFGLTTGGIYQYTHPIDGGVLWIVPANLAAGVWHHIAYCYDGAQQRIYLNGTLLESRPRSGAIASLCSLNPPAGNAGIGQVFRDGSIANASFRGDIAWIRISSSARYSGASFIPPQNDPPTDADTLLLYTFDECDADSMTDDHGPLARDGTIGAGGSRPTFARACCPADLDDDGNFTNGGARDGAVTIDDLIYFLTGFEVGSPAIDLDNDGDPAVGTPDGGVDINDLLFFLARFEGGC